MNEAAKPVWFILFVVVGLATVVFIARSRSTGGGDGQGIIPWQNDLTAAREQSAKSGKPVLLYFTAVWCPPCQKMKSSTWLDSKVAATIGGKYIPVMIDVDRWPMNTASRGSRGSKCSPPTATAGSLPRGICRPEK